MGVFTSRKSRSTKRAEARALKAKAKLEARLAARNDHRRMRMQARNESRARRDARKTELALVNAQRQIAKDQLKAVREGKLLSPTRIKRVLTVSRLLAPVLVPIGYKAAIAVRGVLDQRRADRLGIPLAELGQYSGAGAELSARVTGAEQAVRSVLEKAPKNAETKKFAAAMGGRLTELSTAIGAAEHMPPTRRRAAHSAIARELDGIDADLLARLGVK